MYKGQTGVAKGFVIFLGVLLVLASTSVGIAQSKITFWHVWDGARMPLIDNLVNDFETKYPDIKVEAELVSQQGLMEKYLTAIAGGSPPDVIQINASFLTAFAERGALLELDDYLNRDGLKPYEMFYASEYEAFVVDGTTFALPLDVSGSYLYFWDKDQFAEVGLDPEKAPETWEELEEFAKQLTIKNADGSFERLGFHPAAISNNPFLVWTYLNDGSMYLEDGRTVNFDSAEGRETMEWMVGFVERLYGGYDNILPFLGDPTDKGWHVTGLFSTGHIASHISGVWHFAQLEANAPDKNYGVAVLPYNGSNPNATLNQPVSGGWGYGIPRGADNPDAAWEFIKYSTAEEGSLNFFLAQQRPSSSEIVNSDPRFAEINPHWDVVNETLANREFLPNLPIQTEIFDLLKEMTELAIRGKMSPVDAVEWGAKQVQDLVNSHFD